MNNVSSFMQGWLTSQAASQDVIAVKRVYVDINGGNIYDGILFSQIMYWFSPSGNKSRLRVERDGRLWLAKSYADWWGECRIHERQARACIGRMVERGLITKRVFKFDGVPTVHISVNFDAVEKAILAAVSTNPDWTNLENANEPDTRCRGNLTPDVRSITETTTETTKNKKESARMCVHVKSEAHADQKQGVGSLSDDAEGGGTGSGQKVDVGAHKPSRPPFPRYGPRAAENPALRMERSLARVHPLYDAYARCFDYPVPPPTQLDLDAAWWLEDNGYRQEHVERMTRYRIKHGGGSTRFVFVARDAHVILQQAGLPVQVINASPPIAQSDNGSQGEYVDVGELLVQVASSLTG